jgi:hypothetical protein
MNWRNPYESVAVRAQLGRDCRPRVPRASALRFGTVVRVGMAVTLALLLSTLALSACGREVVAGRPEKLCGQVLWGGAATLPIRLWEQQGQEITVNPAQPILLMLPQPANCSSGGELALVPPTILKVVGSVHSKDGSTAAVALQPEVVGIETISATVGGKTSELRINVSGH